MDHHRYAGRSKGSSVKLYESYNMNNILGGIFGLILDLEPYKRYFFAGLAGIFLYTSLCSIFPVINDILNECRQHTIEMKGQLSAEDMKTLRSKEILRIFIVNFGFFSALGFMAPLVSQSDIQNVAFDR